MTRRAFYFVMCATLSWGFVLTAMVAKSIAEWRPGTMGFRFVGLGVPLIGILLSAIRNNPFISFIGFNLIVGGLSAVLGPALAHYAGVHPGLVERAANFTGMMTVIMASSGVLFPNFYRRIGEVLFGALICLVVVSFVRMFVPSLQGVGVIDYIAAGIFSLYIGFDMWRANTLPATLCNAIDVAIALYLDIINLFLYVLRIMEGDD